MLPVAALWAVSDHIALKIGERVDVRKWCYCSLIADLAALIPLSERTRLRQPLLVSGQWLLIFLSSLAVFSFSFVQFKEKS